MTQTPLHDWLTPRLARLVADAVAAGFARDATVAVIVDLATGAPFDTAPAPAEPEPLPQGVPEAARD
jgi:hypothetical protein